MNNEVLLYTDENSTVAKNATVWLSWKKMQLSGISGWLMVKLVVNLLGE